MEAKIWTRSMGAYHHIQAYVFLEMMRRWEGLEGRLKKDLDSKGGRNEEEDEERHFNDLHPLKDDDDEERANVGKVT